MSNRRWLSLVLVGALLLVAAACAQHIKRGSVAVIRSDELEVDWGTGVTEMTGNVRVDIKGDYAATMWASAVTVRADLEKAQVLSLEAHGPVKFDIDTAPVEGKRSHIEATCKRQATFSEQTMTATLEGNAHVEITGAGAMVSQVESVRYDGDSLTIDLTNHKIKLKQATAEVQMAPGAEKPAAPQGKP